MTFAKSTYAQKNRLIVANTRQKKDEAEQPETGKPKADGNATSEWSRFKNKLGMRRIKYTRSERRRRSQKNQRG